MKYNWKSTGNGILDNLGRQFEKTVRNMNENKFGTRYRYIASDQRFIQFLAKEFKLQKLANINDKHIEKYATKLMEEGKSHKYIKTELSGIRFLHNSMENAKNILEDPTKFNNRIGLSQTKDGRSERAWTEREFQLMKEYAVEVGRREIADVFEGIRHTGMRLDEICSLRDYEVRAALENGELHLTNTKGGVPRNVKLNEKSRSLFIDKLKGIEAKGYVFTPKKYVMQKRIHSFKKDIQNFLYYHRSKVQDHDRSKSGHNLQAKEKGALTIHGLRHTYAREKYFDLRDKGYSKTQARMEVARMLGHGRDSVTFIYLAGLEG